MVKKKKNPNKDNVEKDLEIVDLEEEISNGVVTSWKVSKDNLKRLKVESAKKGLTMAGYLRDLVSTRFKANDRAKKGVSSKLENIIKESVGFWDTFKVATFIDNMFEAGIDLSDLNNGEWIDVRSKIRSGSEYFANGRSGEDVVVEFDLISPTRKQRLDLVKIFRE